MNDFGFVQANEKSLIDSNAIFIHTPEKYGSIGKVSVVGYSKSIRYGVRFSSIILGAPKWYNHLSSDHM
jgi:hypothetical protein